MKWRELLKKIADDTGVSQRDVRAVLETTVDAISDELANDGRVVVRGLGTFSTREVAGRPVRSISSGRKLWIDKHPVPRFRPSKRLREAVHHTEERPWRDPAHQAAWRLAETLVGDLDLYHAEARPETVPEADPVAVDQVCADAFGPPWQRARETYKARTNGVSVDYLGLAARRRWGD